jgi:hypothetical protein
MSLTFCIRSSFVIGFPIKQFASNSGNTCFLASSYTFIAQYMILCDLGVPVYLDCSPVLMVTVSLFSVSEIIEVRLCLHERYST